MSCIGTKPETKTRVGSVESREVGTKHDVKLMIISVDRRDEPEAWVFGTSLTGNFHGMRRDSRDKPKKYRGGEPGGGRPHRAKCTALFHLPLIMLGPTTSA